ncbi:hypothetical protein F5X71_31550 [Nocardia brasiliensis]|uniref:Uncharacterized protein n=1 Tax=Nocardia brasiliensis TaxID=37326 RepID=A0A6G9XZG8_NOCBR|nr:hypothetical protein [Nocardia brasiliensis]QIS06237.1 hypothetical protein F5X71_31550 [Nocardia brasiliensis]
MRLESLLSGDHVRAAEVVQWNPLVTEDLLLEACVLDIRYMPHIASVGLLLDLRTALQIDEGNTGLLVIEQALDLKILTERPHGLKVSTIVGSVPHVSFPMGYSIEIACMPSSLISVSGERAYFHVGDVDGIGEAQPVIEGGVLPPVGFQSWESCIKLVYTTDSSSTV